MEPKQHSHCGEPCEADPRKETERRRDENLRHILRVIAVMSGKGGVGKSTIAAALALGLARRGLKTGLLDVDFHGPSVPTLLGLVGQRAISDGETLQPFEVEPALRVMSLGLLLGGGDEAVIWRGPMKIGVIDQLLGEVAWGDLDVLVVDCPPGTGDEPLSIAQVIPMAEVVMVGTPQEVAMADVRKAVAFCRKLDLMLLGLVETMGTVPCPHCGQDVPLFRAAAGARPPDIPLLAEIPFDPDLQAACDEGRLADFLASDGPAARRLLDLAGQIAGGATPQKAPEQAASANKNQGDSRMRYAIPTADGLLSAHFGHADQFTFVDVKDGAIQDIQTVKPPPHAPGVLPAWCKEHGVDIVIAGGMGSRAQSLFAEQGIQTIVGAPSEPADELVRKHLAGALATGTNVCDH